MPKQQSELPAEPKRSAEATAQLLQNLGIVLSLLKGSELLESARLLDMRAKFDEFRLSVGVEISNLEQYPPAPSLEDPLFPHEKVPTEIEFLNEQTQKLDSYLEGIAWMETLLRQLTEEIVLINKAIEALDLRVVLPANQALRVQEILDDRLPRTPELDFLQRLKDDYIKYLANKDYGSEV